MLLRVPKNCLYGTKDSLEIVFLKQRTEQRGCNVGFGDTRDRIFKIVHHMKW